MLKARTSRRRRAGVGLQRAATRSTTSSNSTPASTTSNWLTCRQRQKFLIWRTRTSTWKWTTSRKGRSQAEWFRTITTKRKSIRIFQIWIYPRVALRWLTPTARQGNPARASLTSTKRPRWTAAQKMNGKFGQRTSHRPTKQSTLPTGSKT